MGSDKKNWKLYDQRDGKELGPMCREQLLFMVSALTAEDHKYCFLWKNGWPEWKKLTLFDFTKEKIRDRRQFERKDLKLRVTFVNEARVFRTYTKNVSLGGFMLESDVPPVFSESPCQVLLFNEKLALGLEFKVSLVFSNKSNRVKILRDEAGRSALDALGGWIKQMAKTDKKAA